MTVLRASSLAAVTILVWSTRLNLSSCVSFRTAWRASTTSCSVRRGRASDLRTAIRDLLTGERVAAPIAARFTARVVNGLAQALHAALDVERRLHAFERQPQLHQRDRHRRPHPDEDGAGVEDARHAGDAGDHPADERVDHL